VVAGKILNGSRGLAGEIGHMTIADEGPLVIAEIGMLGGPGLGTALAKAARKRIETGADTTILSFGGGEID